MAKARKTGGRRAGTPNRDTKEISELLESLGHNPIEVVVQIARNPEASLELCGRMNTELAQYVYPKCKAVEHRRRGRWWPLTVTVRSVLDRPPEK
jgi:hypothetical protein